MERLRTGLQKDNPSFDIIQGILENAATSEKDQRATLFNRDSTPMTTKTSIQYFNSKLRKDNPSFGIIQGILQIESKGNLAINPVKRDIDPMLIRMKTAKNELYTELGKGSPNFDIVQGIIKNAAKNNHDLITKVIDVNNQKYVLHYACWKNAPSDYVRSLIKHYPVAVQVQDTNESLVQEYPQAVRVVQYRDFYGKCYPLLLACEMNRSEFVIQLLLDAYPEAVQCPTYEGYYPLHVACEHHKSESVIRLLLDLYPRAVQEKTRYYDYYPFHLACESNQPLSVLQLLLREYPPAIREIADRGEYPLHLALGCTNQCVSVIRFLLKEYPAAINKPARLHPLMLACQFAPTATNQSEAIIRLLVQEYPESVKECNVIEKFALHVACRHHHSDAILRLLSFPQAASQKYHNGGAATEGDYPLHFACGVESFQRSVDIIQLLINHCPWAVKAKDYYLQYPLHVACISNQSEAVLQLLLQTYPEAQYQKDHYGFRPFDYVTKRRYNMYSWMLINYCS